jgi:dynein intermediate chain
MADRRRAEIEEKRAKLAELRRARDERKALLAQADKTVEVRPLSGGLPGVYC